MDKNWSRTLEIIKNQLSPANFRTWFGSVQVDTSVEDRLILKTPSAFVKEQLSLRYAPIITAAIKQASGRDIPLVFVIDSSLEPKKEKVETEEEFDFQFAPPPTNQNINLNPKYTLQNFVVGLSNNLAFAAAQAVAQNPGTTYNPLFIYGGTGVGKTHLMQAVGNALVEKNPRLKIVYTNYYYFRPATD
jgi:chromosomal replication initiator protein